MNDVDDLDGVDRHAIDQDIIRVDNRLTRALDSTRSIHGGMEGQALGAGLDRLLKTLGG